MAEQLGDSCGVNHLYAVKYNPYNKVVQCHICGTIYEPSEVGCELLSVKENEMYDRFCRFVAWLMPPRIVMWCAIRIMAYATQGKYGNQNVPELTAMDALKRWEDK